MYPDAGNPAPQIQSVAVAPINEDLAVCAVTPQGGLYYTSRLSNGTWPNQFLDVVAKLATIPGSVAPVGGIQSVACANLFNELHVFAATPGPTPTQPQLLHTVRNASGAWTGFEDLISTFVGAGWNWPLQPGQEQLVAVYMGSVASVDLHGYLNLAFTAGVADPIGQVPIYTVLYSVRPPGGNWQLPMDMLSFVKKAWGNNCFLGLPGGPPSNWLPQLFTNAQIALASDGTSVHLALPVQYDAKTGLVIHNRSANFNWWSSFDQVTPGAPLLGSGLVTAASMAGSE